MSPRIAVPTIGEALGADELDRRAEREQGLLRLSHLQFFKTAGDEHSDVLSGERFVHMYLSHSWAGVLPGSSAARDVFPRRITETWPPHGGQNIR